MDNDYSCKTSIRSFLVIGWSPSASSSAPGGGGGGGGAAAQGDQPITRKDLMEVLREQSLSICVASIAAVQH